MIAGVRDSDLLQAAYALEEMGGGFVCVVDGQVRASVPLPNLWVGASPQPASEVVTQLETLDAVAAELGNYLEHPCMTLSFLSLYLFVAQANGSGIN